MNNDTNPGYSDSTPLKNGDEIGLFTAKGLCCGAIVWKGANTAITVCGNDKQTTEVDGFETGDTLQYRIWKRSADKEYIATSSYQEGQLIVYQANGFTVLTDLVADLSKPITKVIKMEKRILPTNFRLLQNYPNPFNPGTTITYQLSKSSEVLISVYSVAGKLIYTLVHEMQPTGHYEVIWNGKDENGRDVASGIYIYRLTTKEFSKTKKMSLIR